MSQGKLTVPSIDDKEDMMFAHEAFNILGFTEQETYDGRFLDLRFGGFEDVQKMILPCYSVPEHCLHDAHGQHD